MRDLVTAYGGFARVVGSLHGMITQQAAMLAFLDDFKLMMIITFALAADRLSAAPPQTADADAGGAGARHGRMTDFPRSPPGGRETEY